MYCPSGWGGTLGRLAYQNGPLRYSHNNRIPTSSNTDTNYNVTEVPPPCISLERGAAHVAGRLASQDGPLRYSHHNRIPT